MVNQKDLRRPSLVTLLGTFGDWGERKEKRSAGLNPDEELSHFQKRGERSLRNSSKSAEWENTRRGGGPGSKLPKFGEPGRSLESKSPSL